MNTPSPSRLADILRSAADYLASRHVDEPRLAAEHLASRLLNCPRLNLYVRHDETLSEKQLDAMRRGLRRVGAGEPVQYVVGQWDFMGHTFKTDRRALVPRPETEILVEAVLNTAALWSRPKPIVADVGTGSGVIVISLCLARPDALFLAFDLSDDALALARENANSLNVGSRIGFSNQELPEVVEPESVDAIVANLPYVTTAEYEALPPSIRNHEPRLALDGGPDGLAAIGPLILDAVMALKPGGFLFLEIGETQAPAVVSQMKNAGFENVAVTKDLAGHDRIVAGSVPG